MHQDAPAEMHRHDPPYPLVGAMRGVVNFETLQLARAMGSVVVLDIVLQDEDLRAHGIAHPAAAREIEEAEDWLEGAKNHERRNGRGSAANRAHPFWDELERVSRTRKV